MDKLRMIGSAIAENVEGIVLLSSLAMFSYGCWLWFEPLGFMAFGGVVCSLMIFYRLKG